ncbi:hypothetical protein BD779DRAFT_398438 [Infundibulicybe gibba]|nr:hypothetical protein BD779DRAFT_398438 [Infundibulicybe gibba]
MGFGLETDEQTWDVTPLRFVHSARAAKTFVDAFADDPLLRYLRAGQEKTLFMRVIERLMLTIALPFWMYQNICFTVMAGRSFIIMDPPKTAAGPRKPCRLFGKLIAFVMKGLHVLRTTEQKKVLVPWLSLTQRYQTATISAQR